MANGATPARMLPQFCVSDTSRAIDPYLEGQIVDVDAGRLDGEIMSTLLVKGSASPMLSICRGSGDPMTQQNAIAVRGIKQGDPRRRK